MKRLLSSFLTKPLNRDVAPSVDTDGLAAQALDLLPGVTLVVNPGSAVVFASKPITRMLGWHLADLVGHPVTKLFAPNEQQKLLGLLRLQNTKAEPATQNEETEFVMFRKNLQLRKAKVTVAHFIWQNQSHACLSLRFTAIEDLELRLARDQMMAFKQASENKSNFLSDISHEIRTPLNGVLGMIDLLASTQLDSSQRAHLTSLKKSSRTLRALIDNVLDLSKIEAGLLQTESVPFNLAETITAVVQAFSPIATAKSIDLHFEHTLEHFCFFGDPHRLSQVLNNLTSNALKFTKQGTVKITVCSSLLLTHKDLVRVTVAVSDTGMGIGSDQQTQVFESFHQTSSAVSRHHGGTGLGLSISKKLLNLMGGDISVTSQPGEGSTFKFWLDLQPSYVSPQSQETAPPARLEPLAGTRILVVEDDLTNQTLLQAWLDNAEVETVCRSNGQEALDELNKESYFDAVLMDVSMPVMDGLTATRLIRLPQPQDSPARQRYLAALPIIGISGHAFSEDLIRCLQAGMTDSLTKPLSRVAVLQKLSAALQPHPSDTI